MLLALAGCGGDEEPADTGITTPELTVPGGHDVTETTPTATSPATTPAPAPGSNSGGAPAGTTPDGQTDSPENDIPPSPDTPEERYERFCDANPGACG